MSKIKKENSVTKTLLPTAITSEDAIIGTCLKDNSKLFEILTIVESSDFYDEYKKAIVREMVGFVERNESFDSILIAQQLSGVAEFDKAGGQDFLDNLPVVSELKTHAQRVRTESRKRQEIEIEREILTHQVANKADSPAKIKELRAKLFELDFDGNRHNDYDSVANVSDNIVREAFNRSLIKSPYTGLVTGFTELDNITGGLQKSDLIILAARPSMGKSALAINICENVANIAIKKGEKKVCVVFSLEMSRDALINRMVSSQGYIDANKIRSGDMDDNEWARYIMAHRHLKKTSIVIDEEAGISPLKMKMKARRILAEQKQLDLIVVDYMQLMESSRKAESRQQEITQISRELKALARELNVPIIALSQLSRAPEGRADHHPQLSDLRESGSLEQDADIVAFLYREEYYTKLPEHEMKAELIIAKQRNGATGTVPLGFIKEMTKFVNMFE